MQRYQRVEKIGEGTYGEVYKARDKDTGMWVALKKIPLENEDNGIPCTVIREAGFLKTLSHPSIIRLLNVMSDEHRLYLVFEYMEQDLKHYLDHTPGSLTARQIRSYLRQILDGVVYCHSHKTIHRDLKPQNLLISADSATLKIADFGLARAFELPMPMLTHEVVTLWYRAPEVLLGSSHYSTAVDLWSVGCIFAEMATKQPLLPGDSEIDQLYRIFRLLGTPSEESWPGVSQYPDYNTSFPQWVGSGIPNIEVIGATGMDLLRRCMACNPQERISTLTAHSHPYLSEL